MVKTLRWGIAGSGLIAADFVTALSCLDSAEHVATAVAARELKRAQEFANKHGISQFYQGYDQLAKDKNVDIVYVSVLNPQHFEVSMKMIQNGKHVLCEKPLCLNENQTRQLLDAAKEKKVFLMEAIWSRCFPVYAELRKLIKNGTIGDVVYVSASFGFPISHVERLKKKELGGGGILDLGVYTLQFQQYVIGNMEPISVKAVGHLNDQGTDESMAAVLSYSNGVVATVATNTKGQMPNEGIVVGTKGTLRVPQFWCPTKLVTPNGELEFPLPESGGTYNYLNSVGLSYEAVEAKRCIDAGLYESPLVSQSDSLQLAQLEDRLRSDVGVIFAEDSLEER